MKGKTRKRSAMLSQCHRKRVVQTRVQRKRREEDQLGEKTDLVDIVCNSKYFKNIYIFTNSKNTKNNEIYGKLLKDLKERALARGDEFSFTVNQVRNKLKKLISECKKAALTIKTATVIDRFQEKVIVVHGLQCYLHW